MPSSVKKKRKAGSGEFMGSREKLKEVEGCTDPELWHACAGGMVRVPEVKAKVLYFPQGHAESVGAPLECGPYHRIPSFIQCRLDGIKYMAHPETDEVYAKLRLVPLTTNDAKSDDEGDIGLNGSAVHDKPPSFAKTLTQSDANNGGGFSVPRYCAETIFPPLDYSAEPPVQDILVKDVLGQTWSFRHIFRGTPKRHLLTSGWSNFVNHKKLVAGDTIVFLRSENGDLCVGVRRANKKGIGGGNEASSGWNKAASGGVPRVPYEGFGAFYGDGGSSQLMRNGNGSTSCSTVMGELGRDVVEAATLAANKQPFEVVYYPRAGTPEFFVRASLVNAAMQIGWCSGMRFKMAFEHEDSLRIGWSMGTITSVMVADLRWPDSPWRLLQVTWDEPELHKNLTRVNPWQVELVSSMPSINLSHFSSRKKLRLTQQPDFLLPLPTFLTNLVIPRNPFGCVPESTPAGMQGARHAYYGISLPDLRLNKLQSGLLPYGFAPAYNQTLKNPNTSNNDSCSLSMASASHSSKKLDDAKPPQLVLFGKRILTEQQISCSSSADTVSPVLNGNSSSQGNADQMNILSKGPRSSFYQKDLPLCSSFESFQLNKDHHQETMASLETGQCKVFMESQDVGWTIDLSLLDSYDELHTKLADMFGIQSYEVLRHVLYHDVQGQVKRIGDEPFCDFAKTARRLTIMMHSSCNNGNGG